MNRPDRKDYGSTAEEIELYANHLEAWSKYTSAQLSEARQIAAAFESLDAQSEQLKTLLDANWPGPSREPAANVASRLRVPAIVTETARDFIAHARTATLEGYTFSPRTVRGAKGTSLSEVGVRMGSGVHLTLDPTRTVILSVEVYRKPVDRV